MITVSAVANASRGELLCITYELLLDAIELAQESEAEERKKHLKKAIQVLQILTGDLDFNEPIAKDLFKLYVYVQGLLIKDKHLEEAYGIIKKIQGAYETITKQEDGAPSIQNAEAIYAGMTYVRGSLNEMSLGNPNRGFKA